MRAGESNRLDGEALICRRLGSNPRGQFDRRYVALAKTAQLRRSEEVGRRRRGQDATSGTVNRPAAKFDLK